MILPLEACGWNHAAWSSRSLFGLLLLAVFGHAGHSVWLDMAVLMIGLDPVSANATAE
jgi:hypothetical protein